MGSKGPKEHTTTSSTEPPAWMRPYIEGAMATGEGLYNTQPLYPGGDPFTGLEREGMGELADVARNPLLTDPALGYAGDTIGGDYLSGDRLREAAQPFVDQALQGVRSGFEGAGGTGGSMEAIAAGEGVTRAIAPLYEQERQRQQQAAFAAPGLESSRMAGGQALLDLGGMEYGREMERYQEPWKRYQQYVSTALGNAPAALGGQITTGTQPVYRPSPFQQVLGLGMSGLGMAGGLGWRPFG